VYFSGNNRLYLSTQLLQLLLQQRGIVSDLLPT
jgi:hypothetical protein